MGMPVQRQVLIGQMAFKLQWVMDHDDGLLRPVQIQRRVLESEPMLRDRAFESLALLIVIAEYTKERCRQIGKDIQGFRLADVPGVYHSLHRMVIEELNDLANVLEVVVGIADDADSHKSLSKRWLYQ